MKDARKGAAAMAAAACLAWAAGTTAVDAQGVGFLTEQQRFASYCTGVTEARMRELNDFLKNECANSRRKQCMTASEELARAKTLDRRLWAYLTANIFASKEQGPLERALAQRSMDKGANDRDTCRRNPNGADSDQLAVCRESRSCRGEARFTFLPP
jgi:hypothetical protein